MTESEPHNRRPQGISISSLVQAFLCPRKYYFQKNHIWRSSSRYSICKAVSCAEPQTVSEKELWEEICLIHPDISSDERAFFVSCLQATHKAPLMPWSELDVVVHSNQFGLYGQLDKYDAKTDVCTLTRCTRAPQAGCWPEDQIRITALLLCIHETETINPEGVYVEYIPSGEIRFFKPGPKEKRQVIQVLRKVRTIDTGIFPEKPLHAPCNKCEFENRCRDHEPKRLSTLFKKSK